MISYKLAKKLKDAGFPQHVKDGSVRHIDACDWGRIECAQPYAPTLSELIDACGDDFIQLALEKLKIGKWCAQGGWEEHRDCRAPKHDAYGSTPEEAVGRLWLALNRKS